MTSVFDNVLKYEALEMGDADALAMFQGWVDSGAIWQLPDDYLDVAKMLFERGLLVNNNAPIVGAKTH